MKNYHSIQSWAMFVLAALLILGTTSQQALSQSSPKRALITGGISESALVTLRGNTHPDANAKNDRGAVPDGFPMQHMMLQLRRPPELEKALDTFIDQLHDQKSPIFHQWINAQQFGERYGLAQADLDTLTRWLQSHGFTVNLVYRNGMVIDFSGTASQVRDAFHTEIHHLDVKGEKHIANMSDPKIPAALAPAVVGLVSLHDFRPVAKPQPAVSTNYTSASAGHLVVPADLATIYNLNPLFSLGYTGQGQTIAVVEFTNAYSHADWDSFRSTFGLSGYTAGSFTTIHPPSSGANNCADPGAIPGADGEAALDVEWASAAAPSAAIVLASCAETTASHGWFIALQNLLNASGTPPAIISMSYGVSETVLGAAANSAIYSTYQQAVTAGISIFVSTGDATAVNNDRNQPWAIHGINMNGFATTPYNVAVGGTDFSDQFSNTVSQYWSPTNGSTYGSALSYIPEMPWNGSCGSTVIASFVGFATTYGQFGFCNSVEATLGALNVDGGAGGPSGCAAGTPSTPGVVSGTCVGYAKPSWQSIVGNPNDGVRDIPDVSLFASSGVWGHAYVFCMSDPNGGSPCTGTPDTWSASGGTSFSAPIMAGIQALANQATGARWGNPNPMYYYLARSEYGTSGNANCNSSLGSSVSSGCVFYDITLGDIDVPCEGSVNCYTPSGTIGVLSTSDNAYQPAFATNVGWDFPTGIGSINAYNLVAGIYNNTYFPLGVTVGGTGGGTVSSNPTGINCPGTCASYFKIGSKVTLNAAAASGSTFTGWSGACSGAGACTVTMNGAQTVTATFSKSGLPLTVTLAGTGSGSVSSNPSGISCPGTCLANFNSGSSVTLNASAAAGSTFAGWSGACSGTSSCTVTMSAARNVTATFSLSSGNPVVSLSTANLTFAGQLLNTTSALKAVTLTNTGTAPLTILGLTASGNFGGSHNCPLSPSTLAPNGNCTINLNFTPSLRGSIPGEITISDNAAGSPHLINLTGTGLTAISLSPGTLAFGTVTAGTTSAAKTVTLTNNLSTALTISLGASDSYAAVGSGTNPCGNSLAAGAKCTMNVTFSPTSNGVIDGTVKVSYNAGMSPQDVQLSGTGTGAATSPLSFSPASMSFVQLVGTTSSNKTLTVSNISSSPVSISIISASGNFQATGNGSTPCGGSLAAGAKCTIAVSFSASINATINGAVAISNGTSATPQFYDVTGNAVLPLSSSASSLTFAAQTVGTTSTPQTITLTNHQSTALNTFVAASGQYAVTPSGTNPCGATLGAGAKCTFNVTFTPSTVGTIKGVVTLGFGASPSPTEIRLMGVGQ